MKKLFALLFLLASSASAQQFNLFQQVKAPGAVGDIYYTSTTGGLIAKLGVGSATTCLWGGSLPNWATCGTITGVALTVPSSTFTITGSGATSGASSMAISFQTQSAGTFLAGPASGGAAVPAWRAISRLDLQSSGLVFGAAGGSHTYGIVPDPGSTNHTPHWYLDESGNFSATPGGGTVTSVDLGVPSGFSSSGGPVTGAGTLTFGFGSTTAANRQILATDGSTNGVAAWRTITGALMASYFPDFTTSTHGLVPPATGCSGGACTLYDIGWGATLAGGTVTSVGLVAPTGFTSTGGPITASGNVTLGFAASGAGSYKFLASNSSGAVAWRDMHPGFENVTNFLPYFAAGNAGIVRDPVTATHTQILYDDGWFAASAGGTVTSVAVTVPTGLSVSGSPITTNGTFAISYASQTGTGSLAKFLASPCGGGAGTVAFRIQCATDLPTFLAAGGSHAGGAVPDPGSTTHSPAFYLGDDAVFHTMPYTGTVASVDVAVGPTWLSSSGGPITTSGTVTIAAATGMAANRFVATPDGTTGAVSLRLFAPGDLASVPCSSSARGTVPATGGSGTQFLAGDCTFKTPTFSSSIEVKQINGVSPPDYTGVSILEVDQSVGCTLSQPNGAGTARVSCTGSGGGSSAVVRTDEFAGNSSSTSFTLGATPATNGMIDVFINGLSEKTAHWSVTGGTSLGFTFTPITGTAIKAVYYTALPGSSTHIIEDYTATGGQTTFTLSHAPAADGIIGAFRNGVMLKNSQWSVISSTAFTLTSAALSGDVISVTYNY